MLIDKAAEHIDDAEKNLMLATMAETFFILYKRVEDMAGILMRQSAVLSSSLGYIKSLELKNSTERKLIHDEIAASFKAHVTELNEYAAKSDKTISSVNEAIKFLGQSELKMATKITELFERVDVLKSLETGDMSIVDDLFKNDDNEDEGNNGNKFAGSLFRR